MKVMVVDNSAIVLRALENLFRDRGIGCECYDDPQKAIERICDPPKGVTERPDFILTELRFKDGCTGTALIRIAREGWGSDLPAAIMTDSFGTVSEAECGIVAEVILIKPFVKEDVLEKFLLYLGSKNCAS